MSAADVPIEGGDLKIMLNESTSLPVSIVSQAVSRKSWLSSPVELTVRNVSTGNESSATSRENHRSSEDGSIQFTGSLADLGLALTQRWTRLPNAIEWHLSFIGDIPRVEHVLTIDIPVMSGADYVFTPTQRGVIDISARPTYRLPQYGGFRWEDEAVNVMPLVSVMDTKSDAALTIALPANENIPHMQVEWKGKKVLRVTLANRGMGGKQSSDVSILFFGHRADCRAALKNYAALFPAYFQPTMPRGPHEGTFYYHHIHDHPNFNELARQDVRYLWSSFWFTHLGEYLPEDQVWYPYTYARWWRLGKKMSDKEINAFIKEMDAHGIGTFAYFNVTEYGGFGGQNGTQDAANARLNGVFANAAMKDDKQQNVPTWENALVMNPGRNYAFWPFLEEQIHRHLQRLPGIQGFIIDRLDWVGHLDYGHSDGLSMVGDQPVENMAVPVREAVCEVCRLAHEAGKRVYLNQVLRVEIQKDGDGICHEGDPVLALGYLSPYRPVSAWNQRVDYPGDLLRFEAQLKRRLQWAVFPHMIAHEFPISQQQPNPHAAGMLEIYTPLFDQLLGKRQVLEPHCVEVDGANDVNLFVNGQGHYVAPVTSRLRFLSRKSRISAPVTITIRTADAKDLAWAHVYSADRPPYRATMNMTGGLATIVADHHGTASMVVAGKGQEPTLKTVDAAMIAQTRKKVIDQARAAIKEGDAAAAQPPLAGGLQTADPCVLEVVGEHVGMPGTVDVVVDGKRIGVLEGDAGRFALQHSGDSLRVEFKAADQGVWYVPEKLEFFATDSDGKPTSISRWTLKGRSGLKSEFDRHLWVELE
ncbi:MAG: hypothetical protein IT427_06565 [Pirellulales bacterium]|nr:hypothetical protein [Pirellulales bacterium]